MAKGSSCGCKAKPRDSLCAVWFYLGIQEGAEDSNGSSESVNGLDRSAEDNDGGDDD